MHYVNVGPPRELWISLLKIATIMHFMKIVHFGRVGFLDSILFLEIEAFMISND